MRLVGLAFTLLLGAAFTQAAHAQDVTEDGLVRVNSSRKVGVFRAPDIPFHRFRSVVIAPIPVVFRKTWLRDHHEMKPAEIERLQVAMSESFRQVLIDELVDGAGYTLTDKPGPDTLRVEPYVLSVNIVAPLAGAEMRSHTYVRTSNSMKLAVELRDASSEIIIGRIINYVQPQQFTIAQFASNVSNLSEARSAFLDAARYTREALDVARNTRVQ